MVEGLSIRDEVRRRCFRRCTSFILEHALLLILNISLTNTCTNPDASGFIDILIYVISVLFLASTQSLQQKFRSASIAKRSFIVHNLESMQIKKSLNKTCMNPDASGFIDILIQVISVLFLASTQLLQQKFRSASITKRSFIAPNLESVQKNMQVI